MFEQRVADCSSLAWAEALAIVATPLTISRKLCNIEAYAPTDNVSELTARANDEGWNTIFSAWLKVSRLGPDDALLIFSVGGGNEARQVSVNLIEAIKVAKERSARVFAVLGRSDGYAARHGDRVVGDPDDR